MKWVELQRKVKEIFNDAKVVKFKDVLEKDKNGWNWVLTFHQLTTEVSLIIHTKIIFKLDHEKNELRLNEFLYLYDLNCKYRLVKFDSLEQIENIINDILLQNKFGENIMYISELLVSPASTLNNYFYSKGVQNYSIYEFNYDPEITVVPCQEFKINFDFNVNNKYDVELNIEKEKNNNFELTFKYLDQTEKQDIESLKSLRGSILGFIKRKLD